MTSKKDGMSLLKKDIQQLSKEKEYSSDGLDAAKEKVDQLIEIRREKNSHSSPLN